MLDAASGRLSFVSAPDFEQPADADADNVYEVTVQVSDGLLTATQSLLVTVSDVAEPPATISLSGTSLPENAGANFPIGTLSGTDPDPGQSATLTFSLPAGQADNDLFVLAGTTLQARHTTPFGDELAEMFRRAREARQSHVVMEVSSHALAQERVAGIDFDVAAFTNLTQDHMDFHLTFENYLSAKKKLFYHAKSAAVNADDAAAGRIMEGVEGIEWLTYGIKEPADVYARNI